MAPAEEASTLAANWLDQVVDQILGQHRSKQGYQRLPAEYELGLVARMNELAAQHPRYVTTGKAKRSAKTPTCAARG